MQPSPATLRPGQMGDDVAEIPAPLSYAIIRLFSWRRVLSPDAKPGSLMNTQKDTPPDLHHRIHNFWQYLKRSHKGTFYKLSPKHLQRCVDEFAGRQNIRELDTVEQMEDLADGLEGKRLRYRDLIAPNGLSSGARA